MTTIADFPEPALIALNGIDLEVFEAGQENRGNPIVLCHGWPEHAYSWRHQMPALAAAGYHVIVPNQRGYGNSSCPEDITDYDIAHLTGDMAALLDHFAYDDAVFVGHDWGANVVWSMALLHATRVKKIISLALPYQARTAVPWIEFMETVFGMDNYFVHFNRQPGVADAVLNQHVGQFLQNLFRKNLPPIPPEPGMMMINLAKATAPLGDPVMSDDELAVFTAAFEATGFTGSINWYRNMDRNWQILADIDPVINQPALMIYGTQDMIPPSENLAELVPKVQVLNLDCGHWIQQEKPLKTTQAILNWLDVTQGT
ncbi:alpha/beta hydrolase [Tateyamaria sp. ANG-S1]|uniref:alpha/beta fold hydrolase n=1 Tax=Tateyamaria sp. ANG-S1 TaxID=1577905 RepID=UPI00057E5C04|nr:alpha/beta hydrolase [Tateyamaria sp. ANG-S1]KIC51353.1 epoxide hydrolase [Tateyamaria sp. ANG-S1]